MQYLTWLIGNIFPYVAVLVLVIGTLGRAIRWQRMPKHFRWTFYPAPKTLSEQARFMAAEIFTFRAVLHQNKVLWIGAWLFHVSMGLLVLWLLLMLCGVSYPWLCWTGAILMGITSLYLMIYRATVPAARALSTPVEFFNLALFFLIVMVSATLYFIQQPSLEVIRRYLLDLLAFNPPDLPQASLFLLLLFLVEILMIYFPFSRMIHMVSKYFAFHKINWEH